ncbi:Uncharacterised protein [Serratia grimesii]|nr:Uncharacterised protein [Serratia grimesii]CAI1150139.1 Uncharacterised protein [Serratia grimesii]CAI1719106.1 Uncharacterised protein [Serratia grimesii]CAI2524346.1 Uncharacterised protein [Serratia grimesii]CAI2786830.1 Uncharacterised protein [Serratia grimesii]
MTYQRSYPAPLSLTFGCQATQLGRYFGSQLPYYK